VQSRPLEPRALATPADRAGPELAESCRALRDLAPEQSGVLCSHARVVRARLADLGLVAGTEVKVIRRAPLGDPIEIEVRGYRLCLRAEDLAGLCVRAS
jgi:ferrous iron transport protein A